MKRIFLNHELILTLKGQVVVTGEINEIILIKKSNTQYTFLTQKFKKIPKLNLTRTQE